MYERDPNQRVTTGGGGFGQRNIFGQVETQAAPIVIDNANSRLAFLRRVYGWMFAGMLATVFGAGIAVKSGLAESMIHWGFLGNILLVVAWIGSASVVAKVRHTPVWNVVAFAGYAAFTGFVISSLIWVAILMAKMKGGDGSIYLLEAGGMTLGAFGAISAYAIFSKRDFSFMRGFLTVGCFVLLGALIIGIFVPSTGFQIAISAAGVLLFSGFVLYDTSKVLRTVPDGEHVAGAMTLYLDFVMLFIYVLRLVLVIAGGGRRD